MVKRLKKQNSVVMEVVKIRPMLPEDWPRVKAIYESGIATGVATFEQIAPEWEGWNSSHLHFGRLVLTTNDEIAGWAALSPVSNRCVYGGVAEISVYVSAIHRSKGIGKKLLNELVAESERNNIWTLQAGIFTDNLASVNLHKSVGFRLIGYRERIGKLNNQWKDNYIFERRSKIVGQD